MFKYPHIENNGGILPYGVYVTFTVEAPRYSDELANTFARSDNTKISSSVTTDAVIDKKMGSDNNGQSSNNNEKSITEQLLGYGANTVQSWYQSTLNKAKAKYENTEFQYISEYNTGNGRGAQLYFPQNFQVGDRAKYNTFDLSVEAEAIRNILQNGENADLSAMASIEGLLMRSGLLGNNIKNNITLDTNRTADPSELMLFQRPEIREFSFDFNLKPKSQSEAESIINIIEFFRYELYPTKIANGRMYQIPNHFNIKFGHHSNKKIKGLNGLIKKKCILRAVSTNYNPTNMAFYTDDNGDLSFNEINLSLQFTEITAISKNDLDMGQSLANEYRITSAGAG